MLTCFKGHGSWMRKCNFAVSACICERDDACLVESSTSLSRARMRLATLSSRFGMLPFLLQRTPPVISHKFGHRTLIPTHKLIVVPRERAPWGGIQRHEVLTNWQCKWTGMLTRTQMTLLENSACLSRRSSPRRRLEP